MASPEQNTPQINTTTPKANQIDYSCVINPEEYRAISPIHTLPEVGKYVGHVVGPKTLSL